MHAVPNSPGRFRLTACLRPAAFPVLLAAAIMATGAAVGMAGSTDKPRTAKAQVALSEVECTCHLDPSKCLCHPPKKAETASAPVRLKVPGASGVEVARAPAASSRRTDKSTPPSSVHVRPAAPVIARDKPPASQRITYPQTAESTQEGSATVRLKPQPSAAPQKAGLPVVVSTSPAPAANQTTVARTPPTADESKPRVVKFPAEGRPWKETSKPETSVAKSAAQRPVKVVIAESDVGCTCHIDESRCVVHGTAKAAPVVGRAPLVANSGKKRAAAPASTAQRPGAADLAASDKTSASFSKFPWGLPHFFDRSIELKESGNDAAAAAPRMRVTMPQTSGAAPGASQSPTQPTLAVRSGQPAVEDAASTSRRTAERTAMKSAAPQGAPDSRPETPWQRPATPTPDASSVAKTEIQVKPAFDPQDSVFGDIRGGLLGGPPLNHIAAIDRKPPATLPGSSEPTGPSTAAPTTIVQTPAAQPAAPGAPAAMMLLVQPGTGGAPASAQWVALPPLPGQAAAPASAATQTPAAQQRSGPPPAQVVANFRYGNAAQEAGATPQAGQPMGTQPMGDKPMGTQDPNSPTPATGNGAQRPGETPTLGEEPETTNLQFLRTQTILLDPGEYEIDIALQYSVDNQDFVLTELQNGNLVIAEAQRRSRVLIAPIEFRYGASEVTQLFVNVPVGWANSEVDFLGRDTFSNTTGIGDVSAGLIRQFLRGNAYCPDGLFTLAFSAPTGDVEVVDALSVPGSALGEGFWSITMGVTFIQTYDPVVLFYGFGYRERFTNTLDGFRINPGDQFFYRAGMGFAVNPRVTLSAAFTGNYIEVDEVNGQPIGGSIREPMQLRFAATISKYAGKDHCDGGVKTVEPYVAFGLTEESIDTVFGISWTR